MVHKLTKQKDKSGCGFATPTFNNKLNNKVVNQNNRIND